MRILYDHQIFDYQRFGGISRYFFELFSRFRTGTEVEAVLPFPYTNNEYLLQSSFKEQFTQPSFLGRGSFPGKGRIWAIRDRFFPQYHAAGRNREAVLKRMQSGGFQLFHPTYYEQYFDGALPSVPVVITAYDMIHERYPDLFPSSELSDVLKNKRTMFTRADRIIAISQSAKQDLLSYYPVEADRISVVYLGNSLVPGVAPKPMNVPASYLLYVGARSGYKNFSFFLRSVKGVFEKHRDLRLICTGKQFSSQESALVKELNLQDRVRQMFVNDDELAYLYQHAALFVFPSLYEGFGIPVVEAMSLGCPSVLSAGSSLEEVGGDAAQYFDPNNGPSIADAVERCLTDGALRERMISSGKKRASMFTWDKTALHTASVYRTLIPGKG